MFLGELFECLNHIILDLCGILCRIFSVVGDHGRGEIGAIDRVVHRDGDLNGFTTERDHAGDTSPHWLQNVNQDDIADEIVMAYGETGVDDRLISRGDVGEPAPGMGRSL